MKKITTFLLLLSFFIMSAQADYELTVLNEPYVNLEDATSVNNAEVWDDPSYTIPVGFDFQLGSQIVSTFFMPNFGAGGILSTVSNVDDSPFGLLIPIFQDIVDRGGTTNASLSPISYRLDGAVGNQILKLEWNNAGFFEDGNLEDFINFQLWLYEGSNVIEYRYGPSSIENEGSLEGLPGLQIGLVPLVPSPDVVDDLEEDAYVLSGDPQDPALLVLTTIDEYNAVEDVSLTSMIPDGTVYRFSSEQLSIDDTSVEALHIFPNPTTNVFKINTALEDYSVTITNSIGQQVLRYDSAVEVYDISQLATGVYFVKINSLAGSTTQKIIKN